MICYCAFMKSQLYCEGMHGRCWRRRANFSNICIGEAEHHLLKFLHCCWWLGFVRLQRPSASADKHQTNSRQELTTNTLHFISCYTTIRSNTGRLEELDIQLFVFIICLGSLEHSNLTLKDWIRQETFIPWNSCLFVCMYIYRNWIKIYLPKIIV